MARNLPKDIIAWIENNVAVPDGDLAEQMLKLMPWQKQAIKTLYGRRGIDELTISTPKKNGKSGFVGALAACYIVPNSPLAKANQEIIIVASSYQQAGVTFKSVVGGIDHLIEADPKAWRIRNSNQAISAMHRDLKAEVRILSSDPRRLHGPRPRAIVCDEVGAWPPATADAMRDALLSAGAAYEDAKYINVSTMPLDPANWFYQMTKQDVPGAKAIVYSADEGDDPFDIKTWRKANPAWRYLPGLRKQVRAKSARAEANPDLELRAFRGLNLNMGYSGRERERLIEVNDYLAAESADTPTDSLSCWGIDHAENGLAAIACYWPRTGRLDCIAAYPSEPDLVERGRRFGIGDLYVRAHAEGSLIVTPGQAVDTRMLLQAALDRFGPPTAICRDGFREATLIDAMTRMRFPITESQMHKRQTVWQQGHEDTTWYRRAFHSGDVRPVPNLILRDCHRWAVLEEDDQGHSRLLRKGSTGRRSPDDAASAAVLAVATACREPRILRPSQQ